MQEFRLADDFVIEFSTSQFFSYTPAQYFEGVSNVLEALQTLDANLNHRARVRAWV